MGLPSCLISRLREDVRVHAEQLSERQALDHAKRDKRAVDTRAPVKGVGGAEGEIKV